MTKDDKLYQVIFLVCLKVIGYFSFVKELFQVRCDYDLVPKTVSTNITIDDIDAPQMGFITSSVEAPTPTIRLVIITFIVVAS